MSVYRQTGKRHADLDSVEVPEGCQYIFEMFWQVLSGEKITYSDLISFGQARGSSLEPFEVEAVMAMDKEYQAFVADKVKAARNA